MKIKCKPVPKDEFYDSPDIGDFSFETNGRILLRYGPEWTDYTNLEIGGKGWVWDGNKEAPTLTPSIKCTHHDGRIFHGYLTAGELIYLNDSTIRPN